MADGPLENVVQELRRIAGLTEAAGLADGRLLEVFTATSEPAALEALVRRYGPMVFGVCRRVLRHTQDAEDAFQATFLVLVRKAAGLRRSEAVGNWLYGVAYRTALQTRTRSARRRRKEAEVPPMDAEVSTVETAARLEMQALLDRELNRLPDKYRAPIILCDLLGKTKKQAAVELRCPEGTVSSRLARGRELLKKRLEHHAPTFAGAAVPLTVLEQTMTQAMPAGLCVTTVKAAVLVANGTTMATLSPTIAAIVQEVMKSMLITKLKPAVLLFAGFALLSGITFVVASGMGVGNGAGDVADMGNAEKPAPAVVVAERKALALAEVQPPPKTQEQAKEQLRFDGKDFDAWRHILRTELKPEVKVEAIEALAAFGKNGYAEEATIAIVAQMKKHDAKLVFRFGKGSVFSAARQALQVIGDVAVPVLARELESKEVNDRLMVVGCLDRFTIKVTRPLLLQALKDGDQDVRADALSIVVKSEAKQGGFFEALTSKEKQAVVPLLIAELEQLRPGVDAPEAFVNILIAIGTLGPDGAATVPALMKVTAEGKDYFVKAHAVESLGAIGPLAKDAVPILIEILRTLASSQIQSLDRLAVGVIDTLGRIGPDAKDAVPILIVTLRLNASPDKVKSLTGGQSERSRSNAIAITLARIGKVAVPDLSKAVLLWTLDDLRTQKEPKKRTWNANSLPITIKLIGDFGPDAHGAVPSLVMAFDKLGLGFGQEVAVALGRIGPAARPAVSVLVNSLAHEKASYGYFDAVVVALGEIGPAAKESIPRLIEIRDAKEFGGLDEASLRALKEVVTKSLAKIQK